MKSVFVFFFLISLTLVYSQTDPSINPNFKIILVKLNTNYTQINALKQRGFYKEADKRKNALDKKNQRLRKAFTQFTQYPVYFFYSQFTDSIKFSKNREAFLFTSDSLPIKDSSHIAFIEKNLFLIGQLGSLKNTEMNFPCFYLSNYQELVLKKPFRYYVRSHLFSIPISFKKIVDKLQYNLSSKDKI